MPRNENILGPTLALGQEADRRQSHTSPFVLLAVVHGHHLFLPQVNVAVETIPVLLLCGTGHPAKGILVAQGTDSRDIPGPPVLPVLISANPDPEALYPKVPVQIQIEV